MYLQRLYLHNFRPYEEAVFDFCPRLNTIYGANAQGKTTLLEAIYFLMTGRSFRTSQTSDLIRKETQSFYLEASFVKFGIEQRLKISVSATERKILYNHTPYHSLSNLLGLLQGVIITPDDQALIKGAPMVRRHFLDVQIAQTDPLYVHYLTRYNRAMRQRNCLLKAKNLTAIDSWEHEMANAAGYITQQRLRVVHYLQRTGKDLYRLISGDEQELSLTIKTDASPSEDLKILHAHYLASWQKMRRREMDLGITLSGPHKDDFMVAIGGMDTRYFASEGQQKSCVAALRLAEWERMKNLAGEAPLMLIDDFGVSLDESRREKLFSHLCGLKQVLLTTTHPLNMGDGTHLLIPIEKI